MKTLVVMMFISLLGLHSKAEPKYIAENSHVVKRLEIWTYGMPYLGDKVKAEHTVSTRWGFTYRAVAGCVLTPELIKRVREHNNQVRQVLVTKYGKNWEAKYQKEVDVEMQRISKK
ncbi:hypothetical protein HH214_15085 [Mucilaginibacter robiniae]|uniref:Uncharacterized protein n=1 Tax=Mucilaginibacter robiniae TaxID=2728022 RepID=A0A7L5E3W7_9SPHI|nr:hypothetical protein [Mucilaginibacter robiniae]QJD97097.1 hypothetical protein HH214_15085 [Mucilaginibacter robiniae]